jgi:hypothetical protein|tara:strand:+ start:338 stop:538 length:201 start_codon:yes stop_codon:yes gene_type:complete
MRDWNLNMSEFYWNEDTVNHFKFISNYTHIIYVQQMVQRFVEIDCSLEDGETEEDLVTDLINKIYE